MFRIAASLATAGLAALVLLAVPQTASAAAGAGVRADTAVASQVIGWD
ncbi:hypothetical protein [Kitasatospora purpeofusca]|uniref:Uncharacterized protein n=1 Tax=Kitasatospora purpeofusca TaxID=67352 RepID=A0ABZ1TSF8_9ACTN|nr:hypothetical protein [Kitasatospora purpeofusca]